MARNGSGTFSKVNTFVAGNTITAAGHNQNWDDLVSEMTNSVAADGQTTITGALKGANGTVALPAYSFASDLNSGVYRIGADNIGVAVNGTKILDVATTGLTVTGTLTAGVAGLDIVGATAETAPANGDSLLIYDLSATANRKMTVANFLKVINDLTADGSPDSAADYVVTYDASATAAKKVLLSSLPSNLPRGYIDGLILSNGTDATNDINISAGKCRDSTDAVDIVFATALGKQLDANWAVGGTTGTPAGGRDTAAGIADGTYHLYAIRTAASSAGDVYMTTQATAAGALSALTTQGGTAATYVYARRIGSITRSTSIRPFVQKGDEFLLKTPLNSVSATNPGTSAVTFTVVGVPSGVQVHALMVGYVRWATTTAGMFRLFSPDETDAAVDQINLTARTFLDTAAAIQMAVRTDTNAQLKYRLNVSAGSDTSQFNCRGWIDAREKDA
jgi:hypothetical protein